MRLPGDVDPLRVPCPEGWEITQTSPSTVRLASDAVAFAVARSARSPLVLTYPVGRDDVVLTVERGAPEAVTEVLEGLPDLWWRTEPTCRRLIVAVPSEDVSLCRAVEAAGWAPVVEVDLPPDVPTLLLVVEPPRVARHTGDLDDLPE